MPITTVLVAGSAFVAGVAVGAGVPQSILAAPAEKKKIGGTPVTRAVKDYDEGRHDGEVYCANKASMAARGILNLGPDDVSRHKGSPDYERGYHDVIDRAECGGRFAYPSEPVRIKVRNQSGPLPTPDWRHW